MKKDGIKYLTPGEVAAEFDLPMRTILVAIKSGRLRALKVNKRVFWVDPADKDAWFESLYTAPPQEIPS